MTTETYASRGITASPRMAVRSGGLAQAGRWAAHFSLAIIFLWFGALKFTDYEATAIAPLIMNSGLVMWLHGVFGIAGAAHFLGVYELLTAALLAARPWKPRLSAIGGALAVLCFLVTISFMFSTPGVVQAGFDGPFALSAMPGQFLLKDVALLCLSFWVCGSSLEEARMAG